jgi:hypothetical protein
MRRFAADLTRRYLGPAVLLLSAACAAGARPRATAGDVMVSVQNDLLPQADLTVHIVSDVGVRRILGGVGPGSTRTLRFNEASYGGQFRLVARRSDGSEITSTPFALYPGAVVTWTMRTNYLSVGSDTGPRPDGSSAT